MTHDFRAMRKLLLLPFFLTPLRPFSPRSFSGLDSYKAMLYEYWHVQPLQPPRERQIRSPKNTYRKSVGNREV